MLRNGYITEPISRCRNLFSLSCSRVFPSPLHPHWKGMDCKLILRMIDVGFWFFFNCSWAIVEGVCCVGLPGIAWMLSLLCEVFVWKAGGQTQLAWSHLLLLLGGCESIWTESASVAISFNLTQKKSIRRNILRTPNHKPMLAAIVTLVNIHFLFCSNRQLENSHRRSFFSPLSLHHHKIGYAFVKSFQEIFFFFFKLLSDLKKISRTSLSFRTSSLLSRGWLYVLARDVLLFFL